MPWSNVTSGSLRSVPVKIRATAYARRPLRRLEHERVCDRALSDPLVLDLVTVAFNNPLVVAHQARLLARHLEDPFAYTIADASTDDAARAQILDVSRRTGVGYVRLPPNPYAGRDGSKAHGLGLNWLATHYLQPRGACHFGFLDHDIYPVVSTRVLARVVEGNGLWGHVQTRADRWYLWPGFAFFSRALVEPGRLDFTPVQGADTGGRLWDNVYSRVTAPPAPGHRYGSLRTGNDPQSDWFEHIGDWIHTFNASGWKDVAPRDHLVDDLLNRY